MKAKDFPTTPLVLLCIVLLVQAAHGHNPDLCPRPTSLNAAYCDYPPSLCAACSQRITRSTNIVSNETFDQVRIHFQHRDYYRKAFTCADPQFNNSTAKQTVPGYLAGIKRANLQGIIERLYDLKEYLTEMRANTTNEYDKVTLCDMQSRIKSVLASLCNGTTPTYRHVRIKEEFIMDNNNLTYENHQRKAIFAIFYKLFHGLNQFEKLRENVADISCTLKELKRTLKKDVKARHMKDHLKESKMKASKNSSNASKHGSIILEYMQRYQSLIHGLKNAANLNKKNYALQKAIASLITSMKQMVRKYCKKGKCKRLRGVNNNHRCEGNNIICLIRRCEVLNKQFFEIISQKPIPAPAKCCPRKRRKNNALCSVSAYCRGIDIQ